MDFPPDLAETIARIERLRPSLAPTAALEMSTRLEETYQRAREEAIREWSRAMPDASRDARLEGLDCDRYNGDALKLARHYVERLPAVLSIGFTLAIHGPVGTGKTTLAWALARAITEAPEACKDAGPHGRWAIFGRSGFPPVNTVVGYTWQELMEAERADWRLKERAYPLHAATTPQWLVLDDIGVPGTLDETAQGLLLRLVDARYRKRRCTIVTSNVPLDPMAPGVLDQRIVDRLTESGRAFVLALLGPSRRQKRNGT